MENHRNEDPLRVSEEPHSSSPQLPNDQLNQMAQEASQVTSVTTGNISHVSGGTINIAGGNITQILVSLRKNSPDDPAFGRLLEDMQTLENIQKCLVEWKNLHNLFNDLDVALGPFSSEMERSNAIQQPPSFRSLTILWNQVLLKEQPILDYATQVLHIPFIHSERIKKSAIKLDVDCRDMRDRLKDPSSRLQMLYDLSDEIEGAVAQHMFWVDRMLRETAQDLQEKSRTLLWGMVS